ncbi:hypothetical protein Tco_1389099 [Tanacetum coccineum]
MNTTVLHATRESNTRPLTRPSLQSAPFLSLSSYFIWTFLVLQSCESFVWPSSSTTGLVYVDDIIFGSTNKAWCDEFEVLMKVPTGRYVVPTGRVIATDSVIVATSGYVVPAAYDISPGRVKYLLQDKFSSFKLWIGMRSIR